MLKVIKKYLTGGIGCFDKEGCPVRVERFGALDVKGVFYSCKKADLEKFKLQEQELAVKLMREQSLKVCIVYMKIRTCISCIHLYPVAAG